MAADEKAISSVWTRPRRTRDRPALSREQIVSEAVRLLDSEGVDALSMRQLGARLGAGATSLYRHVANRDELIELVVDEVYGEIRVPEVDGPADLRAAVAVCAASVRSMIVRHPWIASMLGAVGLSYLGPNVMRLNDRMLALFTAAGFTVEDAVPAISTVFAYVIGMGISEAAWLTTLARSGRSEQEWAEQLRPSVDDAAREYPALRESFEVHGAVAPQQARDDLFDYGLARILDGLEARPRT
ncbi:TetR/AcrR family transcriptional regulator [Rhodococcus daqingensis]|uniref:TetR/AcrR family transcriptional regulator n=1 Tax=Rhodococcus daqingensis TaxID=2479363 RepID=A0ABW2S596_9NOCA